MSEKKSSGGMQMLKPGTRVSFKKYDNNEILHGEIANQAKYSSTVYWAKVDGACEGYYPNPILRNADELTIEE
jgi:hypothetical protein